MTRPATLIPLLLPLLALVAGCQPASRQTSDITRLSRREQLIRLSVDLRSQHPTEDELVAIEQSPELYPLFVDRWLDQDAALDRIVELWNARFLTLTNDAHGLTADGATDLQVAMAIGTEPLALLRSVVDQDLPYSQIIRADHTMANPLLASLFNLSRTQGEDPAGQPQWTVAHYQDGRPEAGILTMNSTWLRYPSMGGNANRARANAVSKMLLCDDYLTRPILLSRSAVDQLVEDPENAIGSNTACQACHSTLDPLAAHLFGFFEAEDNTVGMVYRPDHEQGWRDYSGKGPGFYGQPTANIEELAQAIADDGRFADCATQTAWEGLLQRPIADDDWAQLQVHRDQFLAHNQSIRELIRSILLSEEYRASGTTDPLLGERLTGVRTASPAQLAGIIEGITGYRWAFDGADGLTTDVIGLPVLLGGIDGAFVTTPNYDPGVGSLFSLERLAWTAAYQVARHDLDVDRQDAAIMLRFVTVDDSPDRAPDVFAAQIRDLYLQATGLPLAQTATEAAELATLYQQVRSVEGDATLAWAAVLSAVLRDPRVLTY